MHGVILSELQKFIDGRHGSLAWPAILRDAGLGTRLYSPFQTYPDAEVMAIVAAASKATGRPAGLLLEDFGEFVAPDLIALYRALIKPEWRTLDLLEHTESTAGDERDRQRLHAGDDSSGERGQEEGRSGHDSGCDTLEGGAKHEGQGRERACDDPHECDEAADRYAEEESAVGVLGGGTHRDPGTRTQEEPREAGDDEGNDGNDEYVVPRDDHGIEREREVLQRCLEPAEDERRVPEEPWDEELDSAEELGKSDRGDGQDQP
ncbi:MAG: heme NO-binding domain-containing protein [Polyangiaceae bacterium]|nr:heme NO-binding domain-containing protein [Polyangiaceae bacterium]